jgi:hypothetical protein
MAVLGVVAIYRFNANLPRAAALHYTVTPSGKKVLNEDDFSARSRNPRRDSLSFCWQKR